MNTTKTFSALRKYALVSLSCLYLMGGGFLRKKHRTLLSALHAHFGFEEPPLRVEAIVPEIAIEEVIGKSTTITLTELTFVNGNISPLELIVIASLVRRVNPKLSLEIGTFDGRTTLNMAINQCPGSEVVTLDLPAAELHSVAKPLEVSDRKFIMKSVSGERFAQKQSPARITQLYGDSAKYDFSKYTNKVDLMFIDGSHSYEFVLNDTSTALTLVRQGGIILWHDYDTTPWYGATRALNELFTQRPEFQGMKHISGTSLCFMQR